MYIFIQIFMNILIKRVKNTHKKKRAKKYGYFQKSIIKTIQYVVIHYTQFFREILVKVKLQ